MVYSLLYTYANFWCRPDCMGTDVLNPQAETWRNQALAPSLPEVYRSLHVPRTAGGLRKLFAFAGPGFLVAVGYMDPGNWATDLAGGSRYNYTLLSVIMLSNLMAVLLQSLAIKLNLLFHIPLLWGVCLTALDVLVILFLQQKGFRFLEALVIVLIGTIGVCFGLEILFSRPSMLGIVQGFFVPSSQIFRDRGMLYIAIGILGATVMQHNLYLHSAIVQTRDFDRTHEGKREAIHYSVIDSTVALTFALLVNAAILIVSAATFYRHGFNQIAEIQDAHKLLSPLLGVTGASTVFALALLASGQNSTLTGTLAGQVVMEGFLNIRLRPWLRRLITRSIAIAPAIVVTALWGEKGTADLLILSQVILSMQLSFAVFPLVMFTSNKVKMGEFVNAPWLRALSWSTAALIAILNTWLLIQAIRM